MTRPRPPAPTPSSLALSGAVDLAAHAAAAQAREQAAAQAAQRAAGPAAGPAAGGAAVTVVDVTEATFEQEVLRRSMTVPVVLDFWAAWCGPCKQLSPVLERLAEADGGAWVLGKVDVDAEQNLGAQFSIQSIPTVVVAIGGQFLQGFSGALPEREVRAFLDQVLAAAQQAGLPGPGAPTAAAEEGLDVDPDLLEADGALRAGDLGRARTAYEAVLTRTPGDRDAVRGLAVVGLAERARGADEAALRQRLAADPDDVAALTGVADLDVLRGDAEGAFARLTDAVRRTSGADRDALRTHLLGLFDVLGPDDPAVVAGRRALANALY